MKRANAWECSSFTGFHGSLESFTMFKVFFVTCTLCEVKKLSTHSVCSTQLNGNNFQEEKWSFTWFSFDSIQGAAYRPYSVIKRVAALPHVRKSKTVLDCGFQSLQVELGLWISIANGILDSLRYIPDSKAQNSSFQKQNLPDSRFHRQNPPNLGIQIPFHGAKCQ